jgi:uncharacterized membrane protein YgaE (UPF0421/DUF939 family)
VKGRAARRDLPGLLPRVAASAQPKAAIAGRLAGDTALSAGRLATGTARTAARAVVRTAPQTLILARRKAQPIAATIARLTVTATIAYLLAGLLPIGQRTVLAPLTALIVVQVTTYQTIRSAFQRVLAVVAGVLVALAFSAVVGFTWWSLAILVAAGLAIGFALHLGSQILEVPISAMLILSIHTRTAATGRIIETLFGAAAGMIGGLIFAPVRVQPAEDAIDDLSRQLGDLLDQLATDLTVRPEVGLAQERLNRARAIMGEIQRVDKALAEAEDSIRMNPRARSLSHTSVALRDGLETLEHAAVTVRVIARAVADAASVEGGPLGDTEVREGMATVLRDLGAAARDYGRLIRADILTGGNVTAVRERVEADLIARLSEAHLHEDALAEVMRNVSGAGAPGWPLGVELLTHLSRLSDELQVERRSQARERWPRRGARWSARLRRPGLLLRRRLSSWHPAAAGSGSGGRHPY